MRTTLSIDDYVLNAAKHEALRRNATLSEVATELIRAGLRLRADTSIESAATIGRFSILPPRDEIITPEHVSKLIGLEGILPQLSVGRKCQGRITRPYVHALVRVNAFIVVQFFDPIKQSG